MSYQKLNQFNRPFTFPIPRCDDSVQDIDTEAKYFILVDMDNGYCKVVVEEEARERLAFFTPDRNRRWKVMLMGDLNSNPIFIAMMMKLQIEWDTLAKELGLKNVASRFIVDDVLLFGITANQLLEYLRTVLDLLKHHRVIIKLKSANCFKTGLIL